MAPSFQVAQVCRIAMLLVGERLQMACEGRSDSEGVGAPHRRRGRPRSSGAERAILQAGARLLEERGVRRMSMEAVAVAARVSKATIYRRWPSKDALILDLVAGASDEADDPPASADARADLLGWVLAGLETERSPRGAALQHLVRRAAEDPPLAASLHRRVLERHRERFAAIVERGVRAGQIRADLDAATLLDLVSGPLLYRRLLAPAGPPPGEPEAYAKAIVDLLWPGMAATQSPAPPR
jgi:AcrR family transcriptional regulator